MAGETLEIGAVLRLAVRPAGATLPAEAPNRNESVTPATPAEVLGARAQALRYTDC